MSLISDLDPHHSSSSDDIFPTWSGIIDSIDSTKSRHSREDEDDDEEEEDEDEDEEEDEGEDEDVDGNE